MPLPRFALVGTGRVATTLAPLFLRAGHPLVVTGRDPARAQALVARARRRAEAAATDTAAMAAGVSPPPAALPPASTAPDAATAVATADWVWLAVPDDAIAPLAATLPWRAGQTVLHLSGATPLDALAPARAAGATVAGFHPLQLFADPDVAEAALPGSRVALEVDGEAAVATALATLARALDLRPLHLPPGRRALYHASAGYAASFLLPALAEAQALWAAAGLPEDEAMAALLPLARGTLDAVAARGVAGALSGPLARGDAGVVARHLGALAALDPPRDGLYRALAGRQLPLALAGGRLDAAQAGHLRALLDPSAPAAPDGTGD
jgi:predicted short-subunit dehydrogenase-like oxidoreductase (DUF2520 family)